MCLQKKEMSRICTNSPDKRHNFPIAGGDCIYGCGVNQHELSGGTKPIQQTGSFGSILKRMETRKPNHRIHSELHELVARIRKDFGETATKGKGSFGYYLRLLKPVPMFLLYQWVADIKQSRNLTTSIARCKVFWWKYKQWKTGADKKDAVQ